MATRRPSLTALKVDELPDEVLVASILPFLRPKDVLALGSTSRRFNRVCMAPQLWDAMVKRDFRIGDRTSTDGGQGRGILAVVRSLSSSARSLSSLSTRSTTTVLSNPMRAAGTSGRSNQVANMDAAGGVAPSGSASAAAMPFQRYRQLYAQHVGDARKRVADARQLTEDVGASRKRYCARAALDVVQYGCGITIFPFVYIVAWLVLMLQRLTRDEGEPRPSWDEVWLPIVLAVIHPVVFMGIGLVTECCTRAASSPSAACARVADADKSNFAAFGRHVADKSCRKTAATKRCGRSLFLLVMWVLTLAQPLLIASRLSERLTSSWGVILIPTWLICILGFCLPATRCCGGETGGFLSMWGGSLCYILPALAVTTAILNGANINIKFALVPIWVFLAFLAMSLIGVCLAGCMRLICNGGAGERREAYASLAGGTVACLVLAGTLAGEIIAIKNWGVSDDPEAGKNVARGLIGSALAWFVPLMLASFATAALLWADARRDSFRELWRCRWCRVTAAPVAGLPAGGAATSIVLDQVRRGHDVV